MRLRLLMLRCGMLPGLMLVPLEMPSHAALPDLGTHPDRQPLEPALQVPTFREVAAPEVMGPVERSVQLAQVPNPANPLTPDPNRDRLIQPGTPLPPTPLENQPVLPAPQPATPAQPTPSNEGTISVTKVEVVGSSILSQEEIRPITQKVEGRTVTLEELRAVADEITQLYLDRGYITSRAVLGDQTIEGGVVQIRVIEGGIEQINVEGTQRLNPAYVRDRVALGAKPPVRQDLLEDQLRLLKADPLFENVEASLRPGTQLGQSILTVRVTEASPFYGFFGTDNYSPPSVGSVRVGGAFGYRNVTGLGDEISASYFVTTTGGSEVYDLTYRVPLNPMNGTLQLRVAPNDNKITSEEFEELNIRGDTQLYEVSFRQPLLRNPREEFALSVGFTYQDGQTFIFNDLPFAFGIGPDEDGNSQVRVLKFGQDYVRRDTQGAWALRSQLNFGLGILDATRNPEPVPDGRFFSWLGQLQRVQRISEDSLLIAQLDIQLSPSSLLPSQQFVIGGGQSLRGFRQNARSADSGIRFSVENRIVVQRDESGVPTVQFAPFLDAGVVWNKDDNPNELPDDRFLAGLGVGFLWQPLPRLSVRIDYALPLIDIDDRGEDIQDDGLYFSVYFQP